MSQIVMFRYSDDGGHTWSSEIHIDIGDETDYLKRAELYQQGASLQRVYDIIFTEDNDFSIIEANADMSVEV